MAAKDYAGALVLIKQAQALPDQTPVDTYQINDFLAITAFNLNDHATADTAFEAMANSPIMPDADKASTLHNAALFASEAKHDDKVIKYAQELSAMGGPPDAPVLGCAGTGVLPLQRFFERRSDGNKSDQRNAGGRSAQSRRAGDRARQRAEAKQARRSALKTLETIVTNYDEPDEWSQMVDFSLGTKGIKDLDALQHVSSEDGHQVDQRSGRLHGHGVAGIAERLSRRGSGGCSRPASLRARSSPVARAARNWLKRVHARRRIAQAWLRSKLRR